MLYAAERFQSNRLQSLRESFGRLGALTKLLIFRNQLQSPRPCTTPLSASRATSCSRCERALASPAPLRGCWSSGTSCSRRGLALRLRALPEQPAAVAAREFLPARRLHEASDLQVPAAVAEASLYAAERFQSNQLQSLRESFCQLGALTSFWSSGTNCSRRDLALRRRALPEQPAAVVVRELLPARRLREASGPQVPAAVAEALLYAAERFQSNQPQSLRESFCQLGALTKLLIFRN